MTAPDPGTYGEIFVGISKVATFQNWMRSTHSGSSPSSPIGDPPISVPGIPWTTLSVRQFTCWDTSESFCQALDDPSGFIHLRFSVTLYDRLAGPQLDQYAVAQFLAPPASAWPGTERGRDNSGLAAVCGIAHHDSFIECFIKTPCSVKSHHSARISL